MTADQKRFRTDTVYGKALRALRKKLRRAITKTKYVRERARVPSAPSPGPLPMVIVLDNLRPAVNAGQIVRSADAFGARAVYLVGFDYFDVAPASGALHTMPHPSFASFEQAHHSLRAEGYTIYALEPVHDLGAQRFLDTTSLARKAAFVVGHERRGISFRPSDYPDVEWLAIRQYGAVSCLNVANAATVAMYEYARQHGAR